MTNARQLILASASPRRRELLARLRVEFEVNPANVDEAVPDQVEHPEQVARQLASDKAQAVAERRPDAVVLAADTIVVHDGQILGKPVDDHEAWEMLRSLRGRRHQVMTAIALASEGRLHVEHAVTRVLMREYADDEIAAYIESRQPFDKAGAYAIQDAIFRPVERYEGCYCNVVGLPLASALDLLSRLGTPSDTDRVDLLPECRHCPLFDPPARR